MFTYSKFLCMTALLVLSAQASDTEDGLFCKSVEKEGEITTPDFPKYSPNATFKVKKEDTFAIKITRNPNLAEEAKKAAEDLCKKFKGTSEFISYVFSVDDHQVNYKIQEMYPGKEIHMCNWTAKAKMNLI